MTNVSFVDYESGSCSRGLFGHSPARECGDGSGSRGFFPSSLTRFIAHLNCVFRRDSVSCSGVLDFSLSSPVCSTLLLFYRFWCCLEFISFLPCVILEVSLVWGIHVHVHSMCGCLVYACICHFMYGCVCVCECVHTYASFHVWLPLYMCAYVSFHVWLHVCTCSCVSFHVWLPVCVSVHMGGGSAQCQVFPVVTFYLTILRQGLSLKLASQWAPWIPLPFHLQSQG